MFLDLSGLPRKVRAFPALESVRFWWRKFRKILDGIEIQSARLGLGDELRYPPLQLVVGGHFVIRHDVPSMTALEF